jgi:hypothetical protein
MRVVGIALIAAILVAHPVQIEAQQQTFTSRSEIAEFLVAAGLENARLMADARRTAMLPRAQHAWTLDNNIIGAFGEYLFDGHSLRQVVAAEIANISLGCEGRSLSGSEPPKRIGDATLVRFGVSCDSIDGTIIVKGTLVHGDMRVVFIEHAGRAAFADEIKRADDRIAATLEQIYPYD